MGLMKHPTIDPSYLRQQIVGVDSTFETPFGERLMSYCDYTASGRCLRFVESYLQGLQRIYANTHTEDDLPVELALQVLLTNCSNLSVLLCRLQPARTFVTCWLNPIQLLLAKMSESYSINRSQLFLSVPTSTTPTKFPGVNRWQQRSRFGWMPVAISTWRTSRSSCEIPVTRIELESARFRRRRM